MEQNPSAQADIRSAGSSFYTTQSFIRVKCIMSQLNPLHTLTPYLFAILILFTNLPSHIQVSQVVFSLHIYDQNVVSICRPSHACYMPCPFRPP